MSPFVGAVCGLRREVAVLRRADGVRAYCAGPGADKAAVAARAAVAEGAVGLVSFGLCGGVDPALTPGTVVIADVLHGQTRDSYLSMLWAEELIENLRALCPVHGLAAGADGPVPDPAAKRAVFERTGALSVDMESGAVAAIAAEATLPFIVLRAVIDTADRTVPQAALAGLGGDGAVPVAVVLAALARRPKDIVALARLAGEARTALRALARAADLAGPRLGLPDVGRFS